MDNKTFLEQMRNIRKNVLKNSTPSGRLAILVVGMHRSGTSACAGYLAHHGVNMGDKLMPPSPDNPRGYFEDLEFVTIHDALLRQFGLNWADPRPLPEDWLQHPSIPLTKQILRERLDIRFEKCALFAIKDPRMSRFLPLWQQVLQEMNIAMEVIHVLRSPAQVAASLERREGMPSLQALMLWLVYNLDIVVSAHNISIEMLHYPEFILRPAIMEQLLLWEKHNVSSVNRTKESEMFFENALYRQRDSDFSANTLPELRKIVMQVYMAIQSSNSLPELVFARNELKKIFGAIG